ncbi:MAG TPA: helix-turn-helix domain-containing protein [Euzebyales bacterium]|nr:helix-turn-helix domain-containing protein [Euzebyales bacterium]
MEPRHADLDTERLKALAHPLRLRILGALRITGPSTASRLADQLDESSGLTSYHLRMLAAAGLVEEEPERGTRRDRWWRAAHDLSSFQSTDFDDTEGAPAAAWLESYGDRAREREAATWTAERGDWSQAWRDAADRSDYYLLATADELHALVTALHDTIQAALATTIARRDGAAPIPGDAEHVRLHLLAFPMHEVAGVRVVPPTPGPARTPRTTVDDDDDG